jgi:hypothetical protein
MDLGVIVLEEGSREKGNEGHEGEWARWPGREGQGVNKKRRGLEAAPESFLQKIGYLGFFFDAA